MNLRFSSGMKTAVNPHRRNKLALKHTIIADLSAGIRPDLRLNTERITSLIDEMVSSIDTSFPLSCAKRSLESSLKKHNFVLAKADKGESLVVRLTRQRYDDKIKQFITASQLTKIHFSLEEHSKIIQKAIKSNPLVVSGDPERLFVMNYALPRLYDQITTHKPSNFIRPIVAFYTDPSYLLAKYLASWFRDAAPLTIAPLTQSVTPQSSPATFQFTNFRRDRHWYPLTYPQCTPISRRDQY